MSKAIQRRRGTTAQHASFIGLAGEVTVDTTKNTLVVHDGVTPGGFPLAGDDGWAILPFGLPFPVWDHLPGVSPPPTDQAYRYILLTAGEDGVGEYNEGQLTSESVTGAAPEVVATAIINNASSPSNGGTVHLINTERRALRGGLSGTPQDDQAQGHWHELIDTSLFKMEVENIATSGGPTGFYKRGSTVVGKAADIITDGANGTPRVGSETRMKNIGANYYLRIV